MEIKEELMPQDAEAVVKAESIIEQRVKAKEREIIDASHLIAAIVLAIVAAVLAFITDFAKLGQYSVLWSGLIGFAVGAVVGERIAFTFLGGLIGYALGKA